MEEPIPVKIKDQEEVKEIKEEKREIEEELNNSQKPKKSGRAIRIISRVIWAIIFLIIVFEVAIGVINMQKLNNNEKPVWYISTNTTKENGTTETTYNLGLYIIVQTKNGKESKITLKPFFL